MKLVKNDNVVENGNDYTSTFYLNKKPLGTARKGLGQLLIKIRNLSKEQRAKQYLIIHPEPETPWWDLIQVLNICRLEGVGQVRLTKPEKWGLKPGNN